MLARKYATCLDREHSISVRRSRYSHARTGLSRSTIYRKIAEGTFPAQIKISTNGTGWHESDINRWIADPVRWTPRIRGEFDFDD